MVDRKTRVAGVFVGYGHRQFERRGISAQNNAVIAVLRILRNRYTVSCEAVVRSRLGVNSGNLPPVSFKYAGPAFRKTALRKIHFFSG